MINRLLKILIVTCAAIFTPFAASAVSFDLDSIASWGKFPRFIVNTYRWGDKFFNTYDSTFVKGSGYKFNAKLTSDSFLDYYSFSLPNHTRVDMLSDPSTSVGVYLTYLAVSVGYDVNISNLFRAPTSARSRYRFGFDCSLLSAEVYIENNRVGTKIKRFGKDNDLNLPFNDIEIKAWGIDAYYFFNHKRYSQPAAFSFSKIQSKSQGSFYAGISVYSQAYDFDFNNLPIDMLNQLPQWWDNNHYRVKTLNYGIRIGYGYNWAFAPHWLLGISISPTFGIRKGFVNSEKEELDFSILSKARLSIVWNSGRWFAGIVGKIDTAVINDRQTTFMGHDMSMSAAIGWRFNLW
ncbi:MAG: DUF4421 domain-containing protein [Odoribacter sp.]|nr:DUF4421 domain-containing protein [Odoribacter sp.]